MFLLNGCGVRYLGRTVDVLIEEAHLSKVESHSRERAALMKEIEESINGSPAGLIPSAEEHRGMLGLPALSRYDSGQGRGNCSSQKVVYGSNPRTGPYLAVHGQPHRQARHGEIRQNADERELAIGEPGRSKPYP